MGQSYEVLLYHTEVRWLSRGRVVSRVVELGEPIKCFLIEKKSDLAAKFSDTEWLSRLCYLADIFGEFNEGNLALQGKNTTVLDMRESVSAFISKLKLWSRRISRGVTAQFSTLDQFLDDNNKGQQFLNEANRKSRSTWTNLSITWIVTFQTEKQHLFRGVCSRFQWMRTRLQMMTFQQRRSRLP